MITERDLNEAIAECQGERSPNANTCIKLAAYLTIKRELFGISEQFRENPNSYAAAPTEAFIDYDSGTEFSQLINGQDPSQVWPVIDEMMTAAQMVIPRLYSNAMRQLQGITKPTP